MRARRFVLLSNLLLGGLAMLAVWVLLVWVASRPALKVLFDLTPQQVNSVDPVTVDLMRELRAQKAEVEFHLFAPAPEGVGEDDAGRQQLAIRRRLVDLTRLLLVRYGYLGGESVVVHDYDFYRDTATVRDAVQAFDYKAVEGEVLVVAVRLAGKERRFRKLSLISDLAVIDLPGGGVGPTRRQPVPVLKDYRGEQAVSSALKSLLVQGVPVAYVLRGYSPDLDMSEATARGYGALFQALARVGFEVKPFDFASQPQVPADAALVLVLEPRSDFTKRDAEALYAYVERGGRVFLNYSWAGLADWNPDGGRFGELLGYQVGPQPVFHLIPDQTGRAGGRGLDGNDGVARLQLRCNPLHPVTRRLAESRRPFEVAGARELVERAGAPEGVRREPLLQTGDQGWLALPGADGHPSNRAPAVGLRSFLVGMAFEVDPPGGEDRPAGGRSGQVVVTTGVFCNNAGMPLFGDFAVNVCNWMAERKVLLDIQGSRYEARYLTLQLPQLERIKSLLVFYVPGVFAALGIIVVWLRRRL
jgi:hypothetical protein